MGPFSKNDLKISNLGHETRWGRMSSGRKSFYAVRVGRIPGVYRDWPSAQKQVLGMQGARYKGFQTDQEAQAFMAERGGPQAIQEQEPQWGQPPQPQYQQQWGQPQQMYQQPQWGQPQYQQQGYPQQMYQQPQWGQPQYPQQGYYEYQPQQYAPAYPQYPPQPYAPGYPQQAPPSQTNWDVGVQVWADGSAANGIAGWGYLIIKDGVELIRQKGPLIPTATDARLTNNRAEITALLKAMSDPVLTNEANITFNLDSKYVIDSVTKWTKAWERNGWRKKDGGMPLNLDLLQAVQAIYVPAKHHFNHVPAHTGIRYNEEADRLADEGRLMSSPPPTATPIFIAGGFGSSEAPVGLVVDDDEEEPLYGSA